MQWSLVLLSILGLTISSPIDTENVKVATLDGDVTIKNSLIEGQLRALLEDFRQIMLEGNDDIPILDPLDLPVVKVDENNVLEPVLYPLPEPVPGLHLNANAVTVNHLSTFVVNNLNVQSISLIPVRYRVSFDIDVPVIEINVGQYDLGLLIEGFTLFGNGNAKINLIKGGISGNIVARAHIGIGSLFISLESANIRVRLEAFESHITGLLGGDEALNAFLNSFLGFFVPEAVKLYEDEISQILNDIVLEVGNEVLADLNLRDLLG